MVEVPVFADAVRDLYAYNRWATARILDTAAKLPAEQLHAPQTAGHGSVRDTLLHMLRPQRAWLSWWDGSLSAEDARKITFDPSAYPNVAAVRGLWESVEAQTQTFVGSLADDDLARVYEYTLPNGVEMRLPLWRMMLHIANHGTQHRSEVAAMLTGFGQSPGDLDYIVYAFMNP
jgi:uncharacterized damage-inducible protein DinB